MDSRIFLKIGNGEVKTGVNVLKTITLNVIGEKEIKTTVKSDVIAKSDSPVVNVSKTIMLNVIGEKEIKTTVKSDVIINNDSPVINMKSDNSVRIFKPINHLQVSSNNTVVSKCDCKILKKGKYLGGGSTYFCEHNNLLLCCPEVAQYWDYELNDDGPENYILGSRKEVNWICTMNPLEYHSYKASIQSIAKPRKGRGESKGCVECNKEIFVAVNKSIVIPTNNSVLTKISCDCKFLEKAKYAGGGNYLCEHYNFLVTHPEIACEWDYDMNEDRPENYTFGSHKESYWKCPKNICKCHIYKAKIYSRTAKGEKATGCPFCKNNKPCIHNNLTTTHPELAKEWNYELNTDGPENYSFGSTKDVFWTCPINPCKCHVYLMAIGSRTGMNCNCPYCNNQRLCPHNNFLATHPEIAVEWDYVKNGDKRPENYSKGSNEMIWWNCHLSLCKCHSYCAKIKSRTAVRLDSGHGSNCPYCVNHILCEHSNLSVSYPWVKDEWDIQNELGPEKYAPASEKKVWWICPKNKTHVYCSRISDRTLKGSCCPICNESKGEKCIAKILDKLCITDYKREWCYKDIIPRKRFDFKFTYNNIDWIIEYDGKQHFEEVNRFHKNTEQFLYQQEIDKIKTFVVCNMGFKVIRIDYTNVKEEQIEHHIIEGFKDMFYTYYSDNELYKWLSIDTIDLDMLRKEAPGYCQLKNL